VAKCLYCFDEMDAFEAQYNEACHICRAGKRSKTIRDLNMYGTEQAGRLQPRANGGTHVLENVQWLHKDVNRAKGTLSQVEFITLCRRVTQWAT
jgi:hypothetical protein